MKPFEMQGGESVDFVFDINVVKRGRGNHYNLIPVLAKSGVVGEDVDIEEVNNGLNEGEETANENTTTDDSDDGEG